MEFLLNVAFNSFFEMKDLILRFNVLVSEAVNLQKPKKKKKKKKKNSVGHLSCLIKCSIRHYGNIIRCKILQF